MPRIVQITVPSDETETLLAEVGTIDGIIGIQLHRGGSVLPPGDIVSVELITPALHKLMVSLDRLGIGSDSNSSFVTTHPLSIVSTSHASAITTDTSEATWEEIELEIGHESNMTPNGLLLMCCSGVLAAVGITMDSLHIVVGAMIIAPGFEPISRISLGAVAGGKGWRHGAKDTIKGYAALMAAAGITSLVLQMVSIPLTGKSSYLPSGVLIEYWTKITAAGLITTALASIAGAVLLVSDRSVLTAGVMIALALVPAAALIPMALVSGEPGLAIAASFRWSIEFIGVLMFSALLFLWKRSSVYKRKTRF